MSMFRSAADISSDSASSSDESDHEVATELEAKGRRSSSENSTIGTRPDEPSEDTIEGSDIKDLLDADAESHSNLMTSALLEFYCFTKAADLLNRQHGSRNRYTRESPEAQYIGKKMFLYKSKFLSSHGVLAEGVDTDQLGPTRQYYRDNLDALGLSALEGLDIQEKKPAMVEGGGDLVLASKTRGAHHTEATPSLRLEGPVGPLDLRSRPGADKISTLEEFRLDPRRIPRPLPLLGSSPTNFPLFDLNPRHFNGANSRYEVDFSEIRVVGRGSFGEVYHVKNHMDGQDYAIKKIPLSQKRLQQLQGGNENQLENIMKEIRTLAKLEHANVVRYYSAWIEHPHYPRIHIPPKKPEKLAYENSQGSEPYQPSGDESFGIVFESSRDGQQQSTEDESVDSRVSTNASNTSQTSQKPLACSLEDDVESIPRNFSEPTYSQLSTFGASDGDIFTDGFSHDQSQLQIQRRNRTGEALPAVVLHIQMSLYPIPLSSYLSQHQAEDPHTPLRRHCYHLTPSLNLFLKIMAGVDYLHSKGIIHRDLKPANIFLSCAEERNAKGCLPCLSKMGVCSNFSHPRIGDFGLVADLSHLNDRSPETEGPGNVIPKLNRIVGTEFYCPPAHDHGLMEKAGPTRPSENYFDYTVDESLDVYALGVILLELVYRINTKMERQMVLTGLTKGVQRPTSSGTVRERPVFPTDFDKKVDQGQIVLPTGETVAELLRTCITGMLELQPASRWRCSDVQEHLHGLLTALTAAALV
ncbi:hypothetical protein BDW74DRAFT_156877 [Aspergillus multicolor]|uniref:putative protein kinase n=1 Tax=Aspergillus multicolor TaxID=41759 RepID=UPI003CCCE1C4